MENVDKNGVVHSNFNGNDDRENKTCTDMERVKSVTSPPGQNYVEWQKICRQFLKERELELMTERCTATNSIITNTISQFEAANKLKIDSAFIIPDEYKQETLNNLNKIIDSWKGVQVSRLKKKSVSSFKNYYIVGKNWCDQNKKYVWAPHFWIKMLHLVHNFAYNHVHSPCFLLEEEYARLLEMEIICAIFDGSVQFAQTKAQPLIPNGTVKQSKLIHDYLSTLDETIKISDWIQSQKQEQMEQDAQTNTKRKRTGNAKLIVIRLRGKLHEIKEKAQDCMNNNLFKWCDNRNICIHSFSSDHDSAAINQMAQMENDCYSYDKFKDFEEMENEIKSDEQSTNSSIQSLNTSTTNKHDVQMNEIWSNNPMPRIQQPLSPINNINTQPILSYNATHSVSQNVAALRYSPISRHCGCACFNIVNNGYYNNYKL